MTPRDHLAITHAKLKEESRLENFKPKIYAIPAKISRRETTIHDWIAAHPEVKNEPWTQKLLDAYYNSVEHGLSSL